MPASARCISNFQCYPPLCFAAHNSPTHSRRSSTPRALSNLLSTSIAFTYENVLQVFQATKKTPVLSAPSTSYATIRPPAHVFRSVQHDPPYNECPYLRIDHSSGKNCFGQRFPSPNMHVLRRNEITHKFCSVQQDRPHVCVLRYNQIVPATNPVWSQYTPLTH
jgi:hypothetical protein